MTAGYALAIKRLYGAGIVRAAAKHNLREIAAELGVDGHIDVARIADNLTLRGPATADDVAGLAKSLMDTAGVTRFRKTSVMALELLFTLPAAAAIDPRQYFEQATGWAEAHFGVPVLSCVVHLDEGAPHAHALLLPLLDGRMCGSDLHGGRAKLWAMQTSFHEQVGAHYGLARQTPQKRHSAAARAAGMALLRECFQTNTAMTDAAIDVLLKPHAKDPEPLLLALGFAMPEPKAKVKDSFTAIMTRPCKPEPRNPIGKASRNPIGIAIPAAPAESQPYTCVGKGFAAPSNPGIPLHVAPLPEPITSDDAHPTQDVQPMGAPAEDELKLEPTATASPPALGEVVECHPAAQRQPAMGMQNPLHTPPPTIDASPSAVNALDAIAPASSTAAPAKSKTGKRGNAAAPCGRAAKSKVRFSDVDTATTARCSDVSIAMHKVDRTDARISASPVPAAANNRKWVANAQKLPLQGELGDFQRQRDTDYPATCWDSERGEFAPATGPPATAHHQHE